MTAAPRALLYAVAAVAVALSIGPFLFAAATSLKAPEEAFSPGLLPRPPTLESYVEVVRGTPLFLRWVLNSALVAVVSVAVLAIMSLTAGYALARIPFPGRGALLVVVLASLMIPGQVLWIPNYTTVARLGWVNSYWGLIPGMAATLTSGVFLVSQYLASLPRELEEAATLDGLSRASMFWRVILPLSGPVIATMVITSFMASWNTFAWPVIVLNSPERFTLPVGLNFFKGLYVTRWTMVMAGSMFNTVPVLLLFAVFQRRFVEGVATTGVKG